MTSVPVGQPVERDWSTEQQPGVAPGKGVHFLKKEINDLFGVQDFASFYSTYIFWEPPVASFTKATAACVNYIEKRGHDL